MRATSPNYLLFAAAAARSCQPGYWRFVLEPIGAGQRLVADDVEPNTDRNRLELLAVVRGLEALQQPSQVRLLTRSRYVRRGIRHGLCQWRDADWLWESFGRLVPIRDLDLWQRVDRALGFHQVECLRWQWDEVAHETAEVSLLSPPTVPADCLAAGLEAAARPGVAVPRHSRRRFSRRCDEPPRRGWGHWGQGVLAAMTGLGQPALSRTA